MSQISRNFFRSFSVAALVCVVSTLDLSFITPNYQVKASAFSQTADEPSYNTQSQVQIIHQGMASQINFAFEYGLKNNLADTDRSHIQRDIASLLMTYPEAYDYWEIVNLSITQDILAMYPQLDYITLALEMMPREVIPHHCVSTVTRWHDDDQVEESWAFEIRDLSVHDQTFIAQVSYTYQEAANYPDFLEARTHLLNALERLPSGHLSIQAIENILAQQLSANYSSDISNVVVNLQ